MHYEFFTLREPTRTFNLSLISQNNLWVLMLTDLSKTHLTDLQYILPNACKSRHNLEVPTNCCKKIWVCYFSNICIYLRIYAITFKPVSMGSKSSHYLQILLAICPLEGRTSVKN